MRLLILRLPASACTSPFSKQRTLFDSRSRARPPWAEGHEEGVAPHTACRSNRSAPSTRIRQGRRTSALEEGSQTHQHIPRRVKVRVGVGLVNYRLPPRGQRLEPKPTPKLRPPSHPSPITIPFSRKLRRYQFSIKLKTKKSRKK